MKTPLRYFTTDMIPHVGIPYAIVAKTTLVPGRAVRAEVIVVIENPDTGELRFRARALNNLLPDELDNSQLIQSTILSEEQLDQQSLQEARQLVLLDQKQAYQETNNTAALCSVEFDEVEKSGFLVRFWLDRRAEAEYPRFVKHTKSDDLRSLLNSVMQLPQIKIDENPYPEFE